MTCTSIPAKHWAPLLLCPAAERPFSWSWRFCICAANIGRDLTIAFWDYAMRLFSPLCMILSVYTAQPCNLLAMMGHPKLNMRVNNTFEIFHWQCACNPAQTKLVLRASSWAHNLLQPCKHWSISAGTIRKWMNQYDLYSRAVCSKQISCISSCNESEQLTISNIKGRKKQQ